MGPPAAPPSPSSSSGGSSRRRRRLERRNAAKHIGYDASNFCAYPQSPPAASAPASGSPSLACSPACSLDLTSFRIGGSGDGCRDVQLLCSSLGLSGVDDFAVPVADWEAHKAGRSSFSSSASTPKPREEPPARDSPVRREVAAEEEPPSLPAPAAAPVLPANGTPRSGGDSACQDAGEEEDDAAAVLTLEELRLGETSEEFTGTSSLSTTNDDETSSTTTESMFYISPNGRFRRKIRSWYRGMLLGSGSFGTVFEGISDEGAFFAVKEVCLCDQGSNAQQCIFQLEQEIALLSQFEHENIVQYYGTDKEDSKLYIFLELVTQGSLASLYQKYRLRDTHVSAYTRQILNGLTYLHERNIVHRDIKCANILVHANGSVKLADFGLAKEVVNPKTTYGPEADIWSLGCTVLEMLTRQLPYPGLEWTQALYRIGKGEPPAIPNCLSRDARDFISQCVKPNPQDRPSAAKLLEHPFVNRSMRSIRSMRTSSRSNSSILVLLIMWSWPGRTIRYREAILSTAQSSTPTIAFHLLILSHSLLRGDMSWFSQRLIFSPESWLNVHSSA
uniref:mitogen-activated protein kinase kinase kinase n=1 Tax=Oryza barthii TaxID=65489 RepID=A0A0D3FGH8_9ORYZ